MNIIESQTLQVIRGDDVTLTVVFTDENDELIDITNSVVYFTVKEDLDDTDEEAIIRTSQDTHSAPTVGQTTIELSHELTAVEAGSYYYDLQVIRGDKVSSIIYGRFEIIKDVTITADIN